MRKNVFSTLLNWRFSNFRKIYFPCLFHDSPTYISRFRIRLIHCLISVLITRLPETDRLATYGNPLVTRYLTMFMKSLCYTIFQSF